MLWMKDGKIVIDADGHPIDCDHCPCDDGCWHPCAESDPATISISIPAGETNWYCLTTAKGDGNYVASLIKLSWDAQTFDLDKGTPYSPERPCPYTSPDGIWHYPAPYPPPAARAHATLQIRYCNNDHPYDTPSCADCTEGFKPVDDPTTATSTINMWVGQTVPGFELGGPNLGLMSIWFECGSIIAPFQQQELRLVRLCNRFGVWDLVTNHVYAMSFPNPDATVTLDGDVEVMAPSGMGPVGATPQMISVPQNGTVLKTTAPNKSGCGCKRGK